MGKLNILMCAIVAGFLAVGNIAAASPPDNPPQVLDDRERVVVPDTSPPTAGLNLDSGEYMICANIATSSNAIYYDSQYGIGDANSKIIGKKNTGNDPAGGTALLI